MDRSSSSGHYIDLRRCAHADPKADSTRYLDGYEQQARRLLRGRQWFNQLLFAIGDQPFLLDRLTSREVEERMKKSDVVLEEQTNDVVSKILA